MSYIVLRDIEKIYKPNTRAEVHALKGVNTAIEREEMVAIQGRSGSGKSTLLHIIGCIDYPSNGVYELEGRKLCELNQREMAQLRNREFGFVLQHFGLIPERKVWENVSLPLIFTRGRRRSMKKQALSALALVGLENLYNRRADELSGGEQQRVAIARAIVNNPDCILADEPTGNLDSATADQIMELFLMLHQEKKKTIVIVTHDNSVAARCARILRIYDGRVVE